MKKLDKTPDDALLGAFLQEKRKEVGVVAKPAGQALLAPTRSVVAPLPPPPEDPKLLAAVAEAARASETAQKLQAQLTATQTELLELKSSLERLDRERRLADKRLAEVQDRARGLDAALAAADKTALWADRGLSKAETLEALQLLAAQQPQSLFAALMDVKPDALAQLLNDRLALVCAAPQCQPSRDTVVLQVPAQRCELCGGSDLRAAYRNFAQATVTAGLPSVTFIGGSPAYRETLRLLHRDLHPAFDLDVVAKKRPGEGKRAQATRGLIVIWGGSEVDHDTTIHYRQSGDLVLTMNHRGLSGILPRLASHLQKRS